MSQQTDLIEAHEALSSLLQKCEKSVTGKELTKSRQTLMDRRIRALRVALKTIEKEMGYEV